MRNIRCFETMLPNINDSHHYLSNNFAYTLSLAVARGFRKSSLFLQTFSNEAVKLSQFLIIFMKNIQAKMIKTEYFRNVHRLFIKHYTILVTLKKMF